MSDLDTIREGWDHAAKDDALFNILTHPGKDNNRWVVNEFFQTGRAEIGKVYSRLPFHPPYKRALDFGCGVGRLTQALSDYFSLAVGVDVSEQMIRHARTYANDWGVDNCRLHVNEKPDLSSYKDGTFDFIYSNITLQHMPYELQRGYVHEFVRVLTDNGLAVFQLPEGREYQHPNQWLSMYGVHRSVVRGWVEEAGGEVVDVYSTGDDGGWASLLHTVKRA